jgi:hypothetical protein
MRSMRLAALTVAMTLAFGGLALAGDHDDDHHRDKHEDRRHDGDHDRDHRWSRDWNRDRDDDGWRERDRDRDHDRWHRENRGWWRGDGDHDRDDGNYRGGSIYNRYPRGYPGDYGYPSGGYGYPGSVYGHGGYGDAGNLGFNRGQQDGSYQARKDMAQGKPFNPNPRGSNHTDNGYHSYMGDKNAYRAFYTEGYRSGYQSNFGGRGRGWGY